MKRGTGFVKKHNFFVVLLLFSFCGRDVKPVNYIARVNNAYLTKSNLLQMLPDIDNSKFVDEDFVKSVISSWVKNEIIFQHAEKYHFDRDESIAYKVQSYKKEIIIDSYIHYLLQSNISVSENEIRDYYFKNRKSFKRDVDEARVSHIFVDDFDEANRIKKILRSRNHKETDRLFLKYSFEKKIIRKGESIKEIDKTIFDTTPRNLFGPIPSDYGYHIIEVLSRSRAGTIRPIDDVRDEILQRITQIKIQENYNVLVDSLIRSSDFEIKYENILDWNRNP